jgi:hypothetical protein
MQLRIVAHITEVIERIGEGFQVGNAEAMLGRAQNEASCGVSMRGADFSAVVLALALSRAVDSVMPSSIWFFQSGSSWTGSPPFSMMVWPPAIGAAVVGNAG